MMICVTNIQMDAMISSLRRPSLSTKAIAPKVAATFTAHHRSCFSIVQDCANPKIHMLQRYFQVTALLSFTSLIRKGI